MYSRSTSKLLLQYSSKESLASYLSIKDCYAEPSTLLSPVHYKIKSPAASFEFQWGRVVGKNGGHTDTPDQTFTATMDLVSMYHSTLQSFSKLCSYESNLAWSRDIECPVCSAIALKNTAVRCPRCQGTGIEVIQHTLSPSVHQTHQHTCPLCGGYGHIHQSSSYICPRCNVDMSLLFHLEYSRHS